MREGAQPSSQEPAGPAPRGRRERRSVLLRLDPQLHDALGRWAADELRSTNAHVEYLLRRALIQAGRLPGRAPDGAAGAAGADQDDPGG